MASRRKARVVVVVGKHLSENGFGFYHRATLPYRRMIVSLECRNSQWIAFLIDLDGAASPRGVGTKAAAVSCKP